MLSALSQNMGEGKDGSPPEEAGGVVRQGFNRLPFGDGHVAGDPTTATHERMPIEQDIKEILTKMGG